MKLRLSYLIMGAIVARFCAKLPPRVRAEEFRCMGWRVCIRIATIWRAGKSLPTFGRQKLGDIGLMITTWGISEQLILVSGDSGGCLLFLAFVGATMSNWEFMPQRIEFVEMQKWDVDRGDV